MAITRNSDNVIRTGGSGHDIVDAIRERPSVAPLEVSDSQILWSAARRFKSALVIASSSGVLRMRSGVLITSPITLGNPSGIAVTAGQVIEFYDEEYSGGSFCEKVSGTFTIRFLSEEVLG